MSNNDDDDDDDDDDDNNNNNATYIPRICSTYRLSVATLVTRTRPNIAFILTLLALF
jgi:hypothetical protein